MDDRYLCTSLADIKVGQVDFSRRYAVLGKPGLAGERPVLTLISDTWLRDENFDKIDRRLRQFPLRNTFVPSYVGE